MHQLLFDYCINLCRWDYRGYLYRIDTSTSRVLYYANVDGPWQEVIGNQRGPDGGTVREWIPAQFRDKGLLWWRAQLTRYLLRPKKWVLEYINARSAAMSLPVYGTRLNQVKLN